MVAVDPNDDTTDSRSSSKKDKRRGMNKKRKFQKTQDKSDVYFLLNNYCSASQITIMNIMDHTIIMTLPKDLLCDGQ